MDWRGTLSQRGKAIKDIVDWLTYSCYRGTDEDKDLAMEHIPKLNSSDWSAISTGLLADHRRDDEHFISWVHTLNTLYALEKK